MGLVSTQPLTEVSTRDILWRVRAAGVYSSQSYHLHVQIVSKCGNLKFQVCTRIVLPLPLLTYSMVQSPS